GGPSGEVVVATWNLKEFPQMPSSAGAVAGVVGDLGVDLLAVQEIEDEGALGEVAKMLGASYALNSLASAGTGPRLGLLWRPSVLDVDAGGVTARFVGDPAFPRPAVRADVRLKDRPDTSFTVWVVHLKAGTQAADEETRRQAVIAIDAAVREEIAAGSDSDVLILGDFNEAPSDPKSAEVFAPFLGAPADYNHLTWPLAQSGAVTFLPAGIMLDHIIATRDLDEELSGGAPEVPPVDAAIADYQNAVSDHRPVIVRLDLLP
ncbi:MAG: endonuclease/exonuclease/phosphatase family protein, partial [Polyangiaceae bacterium]|nr:endonuclease/exonuclease/phosphatase family protein [Polyangiaceae bacterium]